ncbi:uncharacterized protein BYT42DRAFT_613577 [Radiomyces spectabilis]|uniref:uncharacterized protein n=1 Tax=Radiomyces spectabilis TaxID=64574 RepID=UPI0022204C02|nr:uncharacterized protein BYT42DRAFT_613577 [Radiomyces spectabilis]KAI8379247.1 hypothetical protein BYT42DRAFT_613577 [Radiomyces spectabilis]
MPRFNLTKTQLPLITQMKNLLKVRRTDDCADELIVEAAPKFFNLMDLHEEVQDVVDCASLTVGSYVPASVSVSVASPTSSPVSAPVWFGVCCRTSFRLFACNYDYLCARVCLRVSVCPGLFYEVKSITRASIA